MDYSFLRAVDVAFAFYGNPVEFARKPAKNQLSMFDEDSVERESTAHDGKKPGEFAPKVHPDIAKQYPSLSESEIRAGSSTTVDNRESVADTPSVASAGDAGPKKTEAKMVALKTTRNGKHAVSLHPRQAGQHVVGKVYEMTDIDPAMVGKWKVTGVGSPFDDPQASGSRALRQRQYVYIEPVDDSAKALLAPPKTAADEDHAAVAAAANRKAIGEPKTVSFSGQQSIKKGDIVRLKDGVGLALADSTTAYTSQRDVDGAEDQGDFSRRVGHKATVRVVAVEPNDQEVAVDAAEALHKLADTHRALANDDDRHRETQSYKQVMAALAELNAGGDAVELLNPIRAAEEAWKNEQRQAASSREAESQTVIEERRAQQRQEATQKGDAEKTEWSASNPQWQQMDVLKTVMTGTRMIDELRRTDEGKSLLDGMKKKAITEQEIRDAAFAARKR